MARESRCFLGWLPSFHNDCRGRLTLELSNPIPKLGVIAVVGCGAVRDYLRMKLGPLEYEVFRLLLLDAQHLLIEFTEPFRGTLTQMAAYPREIVKLTLARNAAL